MQMMPAVKKQTKVIKLDHDIPALTTESTENPEIIGDCLFTCQGENKDH